MSITRRGFISGLAGALMAMRLGIGSTSTELVPEYRPRDPVYFVDWSVQRAIDSAVRDGLLPSSPVILRAMTFK